MNKEKLARFLTSPVTDRIVALSLGGYWLYQSLHWGLANRQGWPLTALVLSALVHNLLIIVRKRPERISVKALHWFAALLACNWWLLFGRFSNQGTALIPGSAASVISTVGFVLSLAAKLSLWRSFGVVPAKRQLRTTGLYGYVRHPIYGIEFLMHTGFVLNSFSFMNLALALGSVAANVGQALAEEDFLSDDPEYQSYKAEVRKRFIPFVV